VVHSIKNGLWGMNHAGITSTFGMEEMSLPNSRRPNHGNIAIPSGVQEMPLPNCKRPSHVSITMQ
jgi:hypothetical protein